jgi:DNA-directed RNA polymerase specialized sigma24 family protein
MNQVKKGAAFQPLRGNTVGALERAIARFERRLWRAARLIAGGDTDVAEDLYQVAIAELWELDPARFDHDDDGYLWRAMIKRMLKAKRDDARRHPIRPPLALRLP